MFKYAPYFLRIKGTLKETLQVEGSDVDMRQEAQGRDEGKISELLKTVCRDKDLQVGCC